MITEAQFRKWLYFCLPREDHDLVDSIVAVAKAESELAPESTPGGPQRQI